MQLTTFRTILAAVSVAAFASACTHSSSSPATASALGGVKLSPAQIALQKEMVRFEPGFDVTKTFLSSKLGGITLETISVVSAGSEDLDKGTYQLKGSLITRSGGVYKFASDEVQTSDLRAGKIFDVTIDDSEKKLEGDLGGLLDIKARCMDSGCKSVSMWLQSFQNEAINSAGVIFTADAKNAYAISNAQEATVMSVARYSERMTNANSRTRSAREDDGLDTLKPHDIAVAPVSNEPPAALVGP